MTNEKWNKYLKTPQPPALLSAEADPARRKEVSGVLSKYIPKEWDRSGSVLCLGCGDGYEVDEFRKLGFVMVQGITNEKIEKGSRPDILLADMHDIPVPDGAYDYIYSKECLEHSPAPYIALREMQRILKKGGKFLHFISVGEEKQREMYHYSCYPLYVWYDLFKKAGLKVKRIYEHPIQIGLLGEKIEKDFEATPAHWSYSLHEELARVSKTPLEL